MDVTGAGQTDVSRQKGDDYGGAWGADGRLYFTSDRNADVALVVAAADGTAARTIAPSAAVDDFPAWAPDGRRIAFTSDRDGDEEIYVTALARGGVVQLTRNAIDDYDPTWSRSGRRIAFIRDPGEQEELWVADADGRNARRILRADTLLYPEWSPNGRWIAVKLDSSIAVVPSSGGPPRLVAWIGINGYPSWSSDGTQLAFTSSRNDDGTEIYIVPLKGGPTRRVTNNDVSESWLDWSPDGRWIAFARESSIYLIRPDGTGERRVPLPTPVTEPAWQPLP